MTKKNLGDNKLSQDDVLNFMIKIDDWISSNKLDISRINHDKCDEILNLSYEDLKDMPSQDLIASAYILSGYSDYINKESNRLKAIIEYATNSINYIVAPVIDNYGDNFVKYEKKYNMAIRENPLAEKLNDLKNQAALRFQSLENKALNMKRMSDIMLELSKRKQ